MKLFLVDRGLSRRLEPLFELVQHFLFGVRLHNFWVDFGDRIAFSVFLNKVGAEAMPDFFREFKEIRIVLVYKRVLLFYKLVTCLNLDLSQWFIQIFSYLLLGIIVIPRTLSQMLHFLFVYKIAGADNYLMGLTRIRIVIIFEEYLLRGVKYIKIDFSSLTNHLIELRRHHLLIWDMFRFPFGVFNGSFRYFLNWLHNFYLFLKVDQFLLCIDLEVILLVVFWGIESVVITIVNWIDKDPLGQISSAV